VRSQRQDVPWFEGGPDLAIEIRSPNDMVTGLFAKADEYLGSGSHAVWIVDPAVGRVYVFEAGAERRDLGATDTLRCEGLLPGFALGLAELFRLKR
jgi:Uma2 family endonuclease